MPIYTKKGDKGFTSILSKGKKQIRKDDLLISTIGAVDEASSYVGVCISQLDKKKFQKEIELLVNAQEYLFMIGANLAGSNNDIERENVKVYEKYIDTKESELPVLKNFILPGGTSESSHLMYARTLIRKAEREVVKLSRKKEVKPEVLVFLNRLSDAVFMIARYVNYKMGAEEEVWAGSEK